VGLFLLKPTAGVVRKKAHVGPELKPSQTIRTGVFWLTYLVYLLIAFGGMVLTAQLGSIARDFRVAAPILTLAVSIDNLANGITRPVAGLLSDRLGRENMMLLMFGLEAASLLGLALLGHNPTAFIAFAALSFLFWGEIFVIFPAICGDSFGIKHAAANNGLLYTAKGTAALTVPLASLLVAATGTWNSVLLTAALCSLLAGLLAKFALVPLRARLMSLPASPRRPPSATAPTRPGFPC
jgi:OFA family oxalate/formate antiporter-like MFS transporter